MRQWLRTLTCIRTGTIFGCYMKANWRHSWFTLGCKMTWFCLSFTGSWIISSAGLETSKCRAGSGSGEPKCQDTAQEAFCTWRGPSAPPGKALALVLGSCTHLLISQNFAFWGYQCLQGWKIKGYCTLDCWQGPGPTLQTLVLRCGSDVTLGAVAGKSMYPANDWQRHGRSGFTCSGTQRGFPTEVGI